MDSSTPRYGMTKPEVDGSDDTWGEKLNTNFDIIDESLGYATWAGISGKPATFPPTLPINTSDVVNLDTKQASQDAADAAETAARIAADTALQTNINAIVPFPEAPNDGQQYVRKSLAWAPVSVPPGTISSDTAPANPADNQMWWESDTGNLYLYYNDGDSKQWVMLAPGFFGDYINSLYTKKTAKRGNRFPNPCMLISQENAGNTLFTNGSYPVDQCVLQFSGIAGQAQRAQQQTSKDNNGIYVYINTGTAKPVLANSDFMGLAFPIEGQDVSDFMWGSGTSARAVLRFSVYAFQAGTYGFSLINAALDRSFVGSFTIPQSFTPYTFEFPIVYPNGGTWLKDTGVGLIFRITPACGSDYVGVAGWQTGNKMAPAGCTNGAAQSYQNFNVTDIGIYVDIDNTGIAPPFEVPDFSTALFKCQRYWEKLDGTIFGGYWTAASYTGAHWMFKNTKRVAPTMNYASGTSANRYAPSPSFCEVLNDANAAATIQGNSFANARLL